MATAPLTTDEPETEATSAADSERLAKVHERALRRFDADAVPQQEQRAHSLICRRFIAIPGAMWDGDGWGEQWSNSIRLEVDKLSRGAEKIYNDYLQNRIMPDFRPAGGASDPETASTLDGLYRADSYHFKAQQAIDNAVWEAIVGGFGAYRLLNVLADPYDKDSDEQRINPGLTIPDADQRVFFDANSKLYDKSDARYAFVLTADTRDAFEEQYPDADSSFPEGIARPVYDWFTPGIIIKAEYYEVEEVEAKLIILTHEASGEEQRHWEEDLSRSDLDALRKQGWTSKTTSRKRRRVHKYLMSGERVLKDQGYIAGTEIPIVPVYGKRSYVDNMERFRGYVSKRMDSQRAYNAMISKVAEIAALAPREKPIFLSQQMPPHLATLWANQEKERHPYALVDPVIDEDGKFVAMGPIGKVEPPSIGQADATILQTAAQDLSEDDDNAEQVKANVSADAMDIAATRVDAKSGIYLDNARQSVQRGGEIYLSEAKEVYCEEGRTVETMSEEGDDGEAKLHDNYTDKSGTNRVINNFDSGKYKVICTVTEATATRRDKAVRAALNTAAAAGEIGDTELASVALLTAVMNTDGEGTSDFQTYARKRLVGMGVVEPTDDEKQQMEQAAQQPDPAAEVATAQAAALAAKAGLDQAKTQESGAATVLKLAQASKLGGPEEAPEVPTGLSTAKTVSEIEKNTAQAEHMRATAAALPHEIDIEAHKALTDRLKLHTANDTHPAPRIRRGSEL